jgi:hypothetical protein
VVRGAIPIREGADRAGLIVAANDIGSRGRRVPADHSQCDTPPSGAATLPYDKNRSTSHLSYALGEMRLVESRWSRDFPRGQANRAPKWPADPDDIRGNMVSSAIDEHGYHLIDLHLRRFWPSHPVEDFTWDLGPIGEVLPRFRVRRVSPLGASDAWLYVSIGAFEVATGQRVEFIIESPVETPRHVETLAMVAYLHATIGHPLHGRIVNIGRPWLDGAIADHFLVSHPYIFQEAAEWCRLNSEFVQFVWLVPITAREADYAGQWHRGVGKRL